MPALIVVSPFCNGVTLPVESNVATKELVFVQVDWLETSVAVLSVSVTSAENFVAPEPATIEPPGGAMINPVGTGGPTVNGALPVVAPEAAEILIAPCFRVFASPVESIVAIAVSELVQVTFVTGRELPSEKVPVAVNCWVKPAATVLPWGDTVMDCSVGAGVGVGIGVGVGVGVGVPPPVPPPAHAVSNAVQHNVITIISLEAR